MRTLYSHRWAVLAIAWLATTAHAQTYLWHKQFSGSQPNISVFRDMVVDANGNVFVVGSFSGTINFGNGPEVSTSSDFFFAKYNASGVLQFFRKIGATEAFVTGHGVSLFSSGGNVFLYVSGFLDSNGQALLTVDFGIGDPGGNLTMTHPNGNVFVAKYNVTTNTPTFAWVRGLNDTHEASFLGTKIATDGSGNAYSVSRSNTLNNSVITRHNSNGTQAWQKTSTGIVRDVAFSSSTTSVVVCGEPLGIAGNKPLVRLNPTNGNVLASLSNNQHAYWSVAVDNSGSMYVAGYLVGTSTAKIQKFTTNLQWTRTFGPSASFNHPIDLDLAGPTQNEVVVAGWFQGTVNFNDDSNPAFTLTSTVISNYDIFAARYNAANGTCHWVRSYPANQPDGFSQAISAVGRTQHFLIGGQISNRTIDVDFCGGTVYVSAENAFNGFIAQYAMPPLPTSPNTTIFGPPVVCMAGGGYTLFNPPAGTTVSWTASPSNFFTTSSGPGVIASLYPTTSALGAATITFTMVGECGLAYSPMIKNIWVGTPTLSSLTFNGAELPSEVCQNGYGVFETTLNPNYPAGEAVTYLWSSNHADLTEWGANYATAQFVGPVSSYASVSVTVTGACGQWTGHFGWLGLIIDCGGGGNTNFVYPNPTEASLYFIAEPENDQKAELTYQYSYVLINKSGGVVRSGTVNRNSITVNVEDLPRETYYFKAKLPDKTVEQRVILN
jgi:hypothetical protein